MSTKIPTFVAAAVLMLSAGADALAQNTAPPLTSGQPRQDQTAVYTVPLYKSTIVPLRRAVKRVSVGNPGVADILVIRGDELYIVGKNLGSTNVVAWDDTGHVFSSFDVEVTHDLETLKAKLYQLLPGENIQVQSAQEQLILSGEVSSAARMEAARELAAGFLPDCIAAASDAPVTPITGSQRANTRPDASCKKGTVVNLMQVGGANQVMLKVTVAEVAHSVVKKLDSNLSIMKFGAKGHFSGGGVSGGASFPPVLDPNGLATLAQGAVGGALGPVGPNVSLFAPTTPTIDNTGLFLGYLDGNNFIQAVLDISKRRGLAKILSEPTLTTMTGQEAKFISGGEFPIPVPQGGSTNSVTIEFKEFGVGLKFLPVVLDSGRINMKLDVSVSDISSDNPVVIPSAGGSTSAFVIPSLTKRGASSVVELADGQTIGIAGLINDNLREYVEKFPGLGDLPIIGALFRSQQYLSGQSELVIFVTPHLARPITEQQAHLPTDNFVPPDDLTFYLLGSLGHFGDRKNEPAPAAARLEEMPKGSFGHELGGANP